MIILKKQLIKKDLNNKILSRIHEIHLTKVEIDNVHILVSISEL